MSHIFYRHEYSASSQIRSLVHRMQYGDKAAISQMADELWHLVPKSTVLVPMPGRDGQAVTTLKLAHFIAQMAEGVAVLDILKGRKRCSLYLHKRQGLPKDEGYFGFHLSTELPAQGNLLLLDNVLATGFTASSALRLVPHANILVYAVDCSQLQLSPYRYAFSGLTTTQRLPLQQTTFPQRSLRLWGRR